MTVIIKCNNIAQSSTAFRITADAPRGNSSPQIGERAFVWTAETAGGEGLLATGVIRATGPGNRGSIRVTIDLDDRSLAEPLGKADLLPHRDAPTGPPIVGLARKLYRHSLTKIASLTGDEAAFLDRRFNILPGAPPHRGL